MHEKVNIKKALRTFSTIISEGSRCGDEYVLNGLKAFSDYDGYTVTIHNDYVRLDIFFHNKILFEYSSIKEKTLFLEKIDIIDRKK